MDFFMLSFNWVFRSQIKLKRLLIRTRICTSSYFMRNMRYLYKNINFDKKYVRRYFLSMISYLFRAIYINKATASFKNNMKTFPFTEKQKVGCEWALNESDRSKKCDFPQETSVHAKPRSAVQMVRIDDIFDEFSYCSVTWTFPGNANKWASRTDLLHQQVSLKCLSSLLCFLVISPDWCRLSLGVDLTDIAICHD